MALLCLKVGAQSCPSNRYLDPIFSVAKQSNVVFGNAPTLTAVYVSESVTTNENLTMDVFTPTGDTVQNRPLIIFAFGGGYIFGTKDDSDIQGLCEYFTKRGYVCASINYRKGLNATSNNSAVRAIYRGAQDWSSAIRWFKENRTTYKVDTNYFFVGGSSAGAFGALHAVFANDSNKPPEANSTGFPTFQPDLGCLSCTGNNFNHSNKVKAVLNCWGAMLDKNFIDAGDKTPILSIHGEADPIVPYNSGSPFSASILVQSVDGSAPIHQRALQVGNPSKLIPYPGQGHCVWGICVLNAWAPGSPTEFYTPILDSMRLYMYPMLKPTPAAITGPSSICIGDTALYYVTGSNAVRYCWQLSGGQVIDHTANYGAVKVIWNTTGNYSITVTPYSTIEAAGTATQVSTTVNAYPPIETIAQTGDTLTVAEGYTYQWYINQQPLTGATGNEIVIDSAAFYSVFITNAAGCATMSESLFAEPTEVVEPTGVAEMVAGDVKLYPSPNAGSFIIEGKDIVGVELYNGFGQVLAPKNITFSATKLMVEHSLISGIYYAKISSNKSIIYKRFLVE